MKCTPKMRNGISGQQRVLVLLGDGEVGSQPVKIDGCVHAFGDLIGVLRHHRGDDTGKDISAAALGHAWIAGCVDRHCPVRMRN